MSRSTRATTRPSSWFDRGTSFPRQPRATHAPNAHFHIYAIAAACLELAGRSDDARSNGQWVLQRQPDYSVEVFKRSFLHEDEAHRAPTLDAMDAMDAMVRAGIPRAR